MVALLACAQLVVEKVGERLVAFLGLLDGLGLGCGRVALGGRPGVCQADRVVFLCVSVDEWRANLCMRTVCRCMAAEVRRMPEFHKLSSRAWASIFAPPAFSTSSTWSMPRFLPCTIGLEVSRFSLSAKTEGMCELTFFSWLRGRMASDGSLGVGKMVGELIACGVRSPKARRDGVWGKLCWVAMLALYGDVALMLFWLIGCDASRQDQSKGAGSGGCAGRESDAQECVLCRVCSRETRQDKTGQRLGRRMLLLSSRSRAGRLSSHRQEATTTARDWRRGLARQLSA
jgi:hypothetical protein